MFKFHNQEEGSKNHFTAGECCSLPSDTLKGYGPTQQSTWELNWLQACQESWSCAAELSACLTASTGLNVWLKQDLD